MKNRFKLRLHALVAGVLIVILSLFLNDLIQTSQKDRIATVVDTFSRVFTTKLEEQIQNRIDMVDLIRRNWEGGRIGGVDEFAAVAETVHGDFTDLQALNWVNARGVIEKVTPLEGNAQALGLDVANLDLPGQALREAERLNRLRITPPITLAQGGQGFVGYAPVRVNGELLGFINLVFRSEPLIENAMGDGTADRFQIAITDADGVIFDRDDNASSSQFTQDSFIQVAGRSWRVEISPTAGEVAKAQSMLDEFVLAFGVCLAVGAVLLLTAAARNKETLVRSEERFALAMNGASDGLFDWDLVTGEVYFSPRWFQMVGYEPGELPAHFSTFEKLLHPDDAARVVKDADTLDLTEGNISENEFRMRHKDGSWVTILSRASILRENGRITRMVGTHVDISELRRQQHELERAAMTDDLTGLYNRRGMSRMLGAMSNQLTGGDRLAILHADLDLFKSVNDMNGHDAGDNVLKVTARRLTGHDAQFDMVARIGGDEFLIAKTTAGDDGSILALANELTEEIGRPIEFKGKLNRVGASIGIAFVTRDTADTIDQTIANADIALNSSKSMGRGRCTVFEPHMRDHAVQAVAVASQIQEGLGRDQFLPFFQPQVHMHTKRIVGFEALARWDHPQRGILGAADFVPFAEKAYLVDAIDDQIFRKACHAVARLAEMGAPDARVSVNLSTAQLCDPALVERLIWTVAAESVDPGMIRIEILEATLLSERTAHIIRNIEELSRAGFAVELDDFGTGHTAIASLRNFPVSRIKIDRTLIADIDSDAGLQTIAGAIIDLGDNLGIEVLAEGIETEAEFDYLASTRCTHAQGFLIGRPMPFEDLRTWIPAWNRRHGIALDRKGAA